MKNSELGKILKEIGQKLTDAAEVSEDSIFTQKKADHMAYTPQGAQALGSGPAKTASWSAAKAVGRGVAYVELGAGSLSDCPAHIGEVQVNINILETQIHAVWDEINHLTSALEAVLVVPEDNLKNQAADPHPLASTAIGQRLANFIEMTAAQASRLRNLQHRLAI